MAPKISLQTGEIVYVERSASTEWVKWPERQECSELTYEPGKPKLYYPDEQASLPLHNLWPGWGCAPCAGDVAPFLRVLDHLFAGADPEDRHWLTQWCAYPLQHPGTKLHTAVVLHGVETGSGKSHFGESLGRLYGKNFTTIGQRHLDKEFNTWAESKQLIMGEEISGSNRRSHADALKDLITNHRIRINPKNKNEYETRNCANFIFTSNHPDAFFIESRDRRFFVHEVTSGKRSEEDVKQYGSWLDSGQGAGALFDYLLNYDLTGFNPYAPARMTQSKQRMIDIAKSSIAEWVDILFENPEQALQVPKPRDLYRPTELLPLYKAYQESIGCAHDNTAMSGLTRTISASGRRPVQLDVKLRDGSRGSYYAVQNAEHWAAASRKEVLEHLNAELASVKTKKY